MLGWKKRMGKQWGRGEACTTANIASDNGQIRANREKHAGGEVKAMKNNKAG